nr:TonB-dependent receptor plug domain-containing protein [Arsenophonus endosymbiont of Aleurodicus floccissimus]
MLGNKNVQNTPFSIKGYTSKYIKDRQAKTLGDVIQHDSSVRVTALSGGILDSFMIRGFLLGEGNIGEVALNGVYGVAPNYQLLTQYFECVEVLKGPGAGLYGMSPNGGVGGVINAVTKRATNRDVTQITQQLGNQIANLAPTSMLTDYGYTQMVKCGESVLMTEAIVVIYH